MLITNTKTCKTCRKSKDASTEFFSGRNVCKTCVKEQRDLKKIDREVNPTLYEQTTKICSGVCGLEKKLMEFAVGQSKCSKCVSDEKFAKRKEDPCLALWSQARSRAAREHRDFTISVEDVRDVWSDTCPVLGTPLKVSRDNAAPNSPSLDRVDNDQGYIPGNICVVSNKFNSMKRDLTINVLLKMIKYIKRELF